MNSKTAILEPASIPVQPVVSATSLALFLFCIGHFCIDMYSGALGALQPMLVGQFSLTFTQAGILGGMLSFSSSMLQPLYGYLSDRFHSRLFTALAPAMAGIFISSLGFASSYWVLLVMVWLGGCGIASFHPQAAANATAGVVRNRSRAMAIFISSGTLGLALGPTFFSRVAQRWGLPGASWLAIPGVILTLVLLVWQRPPVRETHIRQRFDWSPLRAVWKPMTLLYFLVFIRSAVQVTFGQFLPLYLTTVRGYSLSHASYTLSLFLTGGAVGGILGGHMADRFGGRRVIMASTIGSVPFLTMFVFTTGLVSTISLMLGGLILLFTIPVNVVMGQELAPSQTGTISALMMGFAWAAGGCGSRRWVAAPGAPTPARPVRRWTRPDRSTRGSSCTAPSGPSSPPTCPMSWRPLTWTRAPGSPCGSSDPRVWTSDPGSTRSSTTTRCGRSSGWRWMADRVAIAGVGYTPFSNASGRPVLDLATEAAVAACGDAGLPLTRSTASPATWWAPTPKTPKRSAPHWPCPGCGSCST